MKLKKRDPHSPEVVQEVVEMIQRMTPEEALAFLMYRTPGVEETDMTGMFSQERRLSQDAEKQREALSA